MRMIKVQFPESRKDLVLDVIKDEEPLDWTWDGDEDPEIGRVDILIAKGQGQSLIDRLQSLLGESRNWRIVVLPVEATIPHPELGEEEQQDKKRAEKKKKEARKIALREELYQGVENDCRVDSNFVVLTVLSAIVASIGLSTANVAVIIAAMVIAPLLGPIIAFAFGSALGDVKLMIKASKTAMAGFAIGFASAYLIGKFIPLDLQSTELLDRTELGLEIVALALASGAAAALSITSGLSSALVGVMVAVALLPPAVASAILFGAGELKLAAQAGILLALNVVCTLISALIVFVWKGVRPRTWLEKKSAKRSVTINAIVWIALLAALIALALNMG